RLPRPGPRRSQAGRDPGLHAAVEPAAARGNRGRGRHPPCRPDRRSRPGRLTALAELAATGKLVPTIAATFPLPEPRAASATADLAATDGRFPLEEGGAAESGKHGPGKVVLTMPRGTRSPGESG